MSKAGRAPSRVEARSFNMVEEIASAYLIQADGNPSLALRRAIRDALAVEPQQVVLGKSEAADGRF